MKKIQSLALFLLVTTCFPLHADTEGSEFTLTFFDDLAETYNLHHQAEALTREEQRQNLATVRKLSQNFSQLSVTCYRSHLAYQKELSAKAEFEKMMQEKAYNIRSSWMIRDYVVGAAVVGTCTAPIIAIYELIQSEWAKAALCGVATVACLFTWGKGADYADEARFSAAKEVEKTLESIEQKYMPTLEDLERQYNSDLQSATAVYKELTSIRPLSREARATVESITKGGTSLS